MAGKFRSDGPTRPVPVRMTALERWKLLRAARANSQTVSAFLRDAAVAKMSQPREKRLT
jgi:hypothetical protein